MRSRLILAILAATGPFAQAQPRARAPGCAGAALVEKARGLRGVGPDGRTYTALLRPVARGALLTVFDGPNGGLTEMRIPMDVRRSIEAGDLAALDGVEVTQPRARKSVRFRVDGQDLEGRARLEMILQTPYDLVKLTSATAWYDRKAAH